MRKPIENRDEKIEETREAILEWSINKYLEEQERKARAILVRCFVEQYAENKGQIVLVKRINMGVDERQELRKKLDLLTRAGMIPYVIERQGDTLYITSGIIRTLGLQGITLQQLAKMFGGKYIPNKQYRVGDRVISIPVIEVDLDTLVDMLYSDNT